uniref:AMP-dependent synthetase/ligase domain-containing protein n=1 Tax=Panagrolaimus sp. JU765 TaxID=591449 RepID=A0AC34QPA7_9BILA
MLSRCSVVSKRFASAGANFAKAAGFHETTDSTDYAKHPVFLNDKGVITYSEFNNRIGQYVSILNGKLGLSKGDRLIARTSKNVDNIALYFATLKIGAIYIPLNPGYSERETKHFVTVNF